MSDSLLNIGIFIAALYGGLGVALAVTTIVPILTSNKKFKDLTRLAILLIVLCLPVVLVTTLLLAGCVALLAVVDSIKMFKEE